MHPFYIELAEIQYFSICKKASFNNLVNQFIKNEEQGYLILSFTKFIKLSLIPILALIFCFLPLTV